MGNFFLFVKEQILPLSTVLGLYINDSSIYMDPTMRILR